MGWGGGEGAYVDTSAYMFRNINKEVEGIQTSSVRAPAPPASGRIRAGSGQVLGRF